MPAKLTQTSLSAQSPLEVSKCFFCDLTSLCEDETPSQVMYKRTKDVKSQFLHHITSLNQDSNIRKAATELGETQLLAKLSEGDLIAQEAKCHKKYMTKFSNQYRAFVNTENTNIKVVQKKYESIILAKVLMYLEV